MKKFLYIITVALVLAGCSSTKHVQKANAVKTDPSRQLIEQAIAVQPTFRTAQAQKARFSINYAQHNYTISGAINMLTDTAIIMSLQPLLGIELYRMEIMPEHLTVIDKMNRRYVRMTYEELQRQTGLMISFQDIQALCMNRMFVVGNTQEQLLKERVSIVSNDIEHQLTLSKDMLNYLYTIDTKTLQLTSTEVTMDGKPYVVDVEYMNHRVWNNNVIFPEQVKLTFRSNSVEGVCTITMQQLSFNDRVNVTPMNLSKYSITTLSALIK